MTSHVLDLLPLWVEGDLNGTEQAAVDSHLAVCPACRSAAEQLKTSQAWLREAMAAPFDASDQGRLRRRVMDQIRTEIPAKPVRRLTVRPALLAACAATLLVATLVWRRGRGDDGGAPLLLPSPLPEVVQPPTPPDPPSNRVDRQTASLHHPRGRPASKPDLEPTPQGEPTRIEFQTADPNIRIIWLAQARTLPDATLPLPEAP
jgi:hypothetical protein